MNTQPAHMIEALRADVEAAEKELDRACDADDRNSWYAATITAGHATKVRAYLEADRAWLKSVEAAR